MRTLLLSGTATASAMVHPALYLLVETQVTSGAGSGGGSGGGAAAAAAAPPSSQAGVSGSALHHDSGAGVPGRVLGSSPSFQREQQAGSGVFLTQPAAGGGSAGSGERPAIPAALQLLSSSSFGPGAIPSPSVALFPRVMLDGLPTPRRARTSFYRVQLPDGSDAGDSVTFSTTLRSTAPLAPHVEHEAPFRLQPLPAMDLAVAAVTGVVANGLRAAAGAGSGSGDARQRAGDSSDVRHLSALILDAGVKLVVWPLAIGHAAPPASKQASGAGADPGPTGGLTAPQPTTDRLVAGLLVACPPGQLLDRFPLPDLVQAAPTPRTSPPSNTTAVYLNASAAAVSEVPGQAQQVGMRRQYDMKCDVGNACA